MSNTRGVPDGNALIKFRPCILLRRVWVTLFVATSTPQDSSEVPRDMETHEIQVAKPSSVFIVFSTARSVNSATLPASPSEAGTASTTRVTPSTDAHCSN